MGILKKNFSLSASGRKHIRINIITVLIITAFTTLKAQTIDRQIFASAGNSISNANNNLLFTIGEPIIGKIQNSTIISQGFLAAASSSTLAVDDQLIDTAIKVYPNPVSENLKIDFTNIIGEARLLLYNSTGQLIKTEKINAQNNTVNISHLQNGMYLVNLQFSEFKTIRLFKIIKK